MYEALSCASGGAALVKAEIEGGRESEERQAAAAGVEGAAGAAGAAGVLLPCSADAYMAFSFLCMQGLQVCCCPALRMHVEKQNQQATYASLLMYIWFAVFVFL